MYAVAASTGQAAGGALDGDWRRSAHRRDRSSGSALIRLDDRSAHPEAHEVEVAMIARSTPVRQADDDRGFVSGVWPSRPAAGGGGAVEMNADTTT
jgi:hypothetical protein